MTLDNVDFLLAGILIAVLIASLMARLSHQTPQQPKALGYEETSTSGWFVPRRLVRQAGLNPHGLAPWIPLLGVALLIPVWIFLAVVGQSLSWALLPLTLILAVFPWLALLMLKAHRLNGVKRRLPFFIDVLSAYLHAGITLTQALPIAIDVCRKRGDALSMELSLVLRDIEMGISSQEAFEKLKQQLPCTEIQRLAALVDMASRLGIPLRDSFSAFSNSMASRHRLWVRKLVSRRSLVSLFPMLLIAFPVFGVLVIFPAAYKIQQLFLELGLYL